MLVDLAKPWFREDEADVDLYRSRLVESVGGGEQRHGIVGPHRACTAVSQNTRPEEGVVIFILCLQIC